MKKKILLISSIITFSILLDQISKFIISKEVLLNQKIILLENILSITKIYNTGAAFSLFQSKTIFLITLSTLAAIIILFYLIKNIKNLSILLIIGWSTILGGTVGNLIDRAVFKYVIDFIQLDFINFPIFNLADMFINIGVLIVIIASFIPKREYKN